MDYKLIIFSLLGGLALFIYGMVLLSQGLQMCAGEKLRTLLEKLTNNKLKGVAVGALVTMIIQSSSATTVTLVGLINAQLITLAQAVPVIMGSNIGTTITAQLVAFKLDQICLPVIAVGFAMFFFGKKDGTRYLGQLLMGFGILFLGLKIMSSEVSQLAKNQELVNLLAKTGKYPALAILASMIFTELIQSSSATTGLIIAMGSSGLIDLQTAVCFVFGANIGTTITVILAAFAPGNSAISSKRAALCHVLFNVTGNLIFYPFIGLYTDFISHTSTDIARQIANSHTFFNITVTCLLLPLSGLLIKLVTLIIPGEERKIDTGVKYLDDNTLKTPVIALSMAHNETCRMAEITLRMIDSSRKAIFGKDKNEIYLVSDMEVTVDFLDGKIEDFINKIKDAPLSHQQRVRLSVLNHIISDIERIADHSNNICELAGLGISKKMEFSDEAMAELAVVFDKTRASFEKSLEIIKDYNENIIREILDLERQIDKLVIEDEAKHMERLENGKCTAEVGPVYLDILRNLERISDHAHNMAYARKLGF